MPERWQRTEAVLDAALRASPADRDRIIDEMCADDVDLRREVESLLASDAQSEGFLNTSAESFASPFVVASAARESGDRPGITVGRYRLVKELGRGGMGAVWLAERADGQFEQHVALKLIKRGMDSEEILQRFIRERQILARLEHPDIARLLDGGMSDDGRPYFAMELVAGKAITAYCDDLKLPLEKRLQLFVLVARAVGYAHRNLVVHRDIKPSNILVNRKGAIKLLDFGIAKVLDDTVDQPGISTRTNARLMTAEYASPEQLAAGRVTTASDIYQLGVILYELVAGERPQSSNGALSSQIRRPSTASRLESRRQLKGDIDTIVLRALREEPDRRYPSAEDLAEDVERHLDKRPLRFGADSASYRAKKFVQRHRLGVFSAAGLVSLLIGFLTFDGTRVRRERDRARHEADKATEVSQLMAGFLQGWSPDASDRGEVSASKLLGEAAVRAERELSNRPEMLAATLSILGDFHTTLGEWRTAVSLLSVAQKILDQPGAPSDADRAATMARRGRLYRFTGRMPEAVDVLTRALALHRSLYGRSHSETLRVERELAIAFRESKRFTDFEKTLREILSEMGEDARPASPFALEVSSDLGYSLFHQARYDEAVNILRPTLAHQRALFGDVHVATLYTIRQLGSALRDRGDLDEAEAYYREALRISRALYGENHSETEYGLVILSLLLERKNQLAEAESLAREALAIAVKAHGTSHPAVWGHLSNLGTIRLDRGDPEDAEHLLRDALARSKRQQSSRDPDQGDVLNRLAYVAITLGAPDADAIYREAVAFDKSRPRGEAEFVTDGLHFLGMAQESKGDRIAAARTYQRALRIYEKQLPPDHPYRLAAARGLAEVTK
jgi:serine/threonine-protein kinase